MMWGWEAMFMGLFFLLFVGLIVYLIVKSTKTTPTEVSLKENTSLEILKRRYAKGEINKEEFDRMKKDLQGGKCKKDDYVILCCIKYILEFLRPLGIIEIFYHFYIFLKYPPYKRDLLEKDSRSKKLQNYKDTLIIFSLLALLILIFYPFYRYSYYQYLVWIFIIWRLAEILVYQLSIIFVSRDALIKTSSFSRSIALFLINVSEVISIYAILYLSFGVIGYCKNKVIQKPFEALYFSIITISTTGFGDIIPINRCGRILVFSEIAIGILLLVIFFGIFISRWKSRDDRFYQLYKKFVTNRKK